MQKGKDRKNTHTNTDGRTSCDVRKATPIGEALKTGGLHGKVKAGGLRSHGGGGGDEDY
jgi:hypothetical protein